MRLAGKAKEARLDPVDRRHADCGRDAAADIGLHAGGGGLKSTAADDIRFTRMCLNGDALDGARILSARSVAAMGKITSARSACRR